MKPKSIILFMGELHESFLMAMGALVSHKLRSALTLLGVLVGVFSIIVVMTGMRVMQHDVERSLSRLGSQTFMVTRWPSSQFGGMDGFENYLRRKRITIEQAERLIDSATLPAAVGVESSFWSGEIRNRHRDSAPMVKLFGETPGSFSARNWVLREGRLLLDIDATRNVCVLGDKLAQTLFPFGSAVGEPLKIDGISYQVVGVLEPNGAAAGGSQDNFAVVPLRTGLNRYGRWFRSLSILVQVRDAARYNDTVEQVRGLMRVIRKVPPGKDDDFEIYSNDTLITQFNTFTSSVRWGVAVVSSISLLAAGIGIMNIMLVSVTERTREIGIRRAIGAKKRSVMSQFIMEAIVLCEVGGSLGVVLGILGGNGLAWYLSLPPAIPVDWVILGLIICSVIGLVFGTYPAYKAANLDPIDSLRYE